MFQKIPAKLCPRRAGDATAVYASTEKAERELGWKYVVILFFFYILGAHYIDIISCFY